MESGQGESSNQNRNTNLIPSSGTEATSSPGNDNNDIVGPSTHIVSEAEQYMPMANIIRLMRKILPGNTRITDGAKETMQQCVSEFIRVVTAQANARCHGELRKTINAQDILWAMGRLGLEDYERALTVYLNRYREHEALRTSGRGQFFVRRTIEYPMPNPVPILRPPTFPPGFPFGQPIVFAHPGMVNELYYRNTQGIDHVDTESSSNSVASPDLDPSAQSK